MGFECPGCRERHSTIAREVPVCRNCADVRLVAAPSWRRDPPTEAESADRRIVAWLFRGTAPAAIGSAQPLVAIIRRLMAGTLGVVYVVGSPNAWALDAFDGEWCPIYRPEDSDGTNSPHAR